MLDPFILDFSEYFLLEMQFCCPLGQEDGCDLSDFSSLCPCSIYLLGTFWNNKNHIFLKFLFRFTWLSRFILFLCFKHTLIPIL